MSLRRKTLLALGATLLVLLGILSLAASHIWMGGFAHVEEEETRRNVLRVTGALAGQVATLGTNTTDYAVWDDTCKFVANGSPVYVQGNFNEQSFANLGLNLLVIVDAQRNTRYAGWVRGAAKSLTTPSADVIAALRNRGLLDVERGTLPREGIVMLPADLPGTAASGRILMFAARNILPSTGQGPARGVVLFGRFLTASQINKLSGLTQFDISVYELASKNLPADFMAARREMFRPVRKRKWRWTGLTAPEISFDSTRVVVRALERDTIAGYVQVLDITGQPALMMRVDSARPVYEESIAAQRYFIAALFVAGVVFCAVPMLIIEKLVLRRLSGFSIEVETITKHPQLGARVALAGRDEFSTLAGGVNAMLCALDISRVQLSASEGLYRQMTQLALSASDAIFVADLTDESRSLLWHGQVATMLDVAPEAAPKTLDDLLHCIHEQDLTNLLEAIATGTMGESFACECRVRATEGAYRFWQLRGKPLCGIGGEVIQLIGACTDVTERKILEERLSHQAFHDPLTNLPNRVLFADRLEQALSRASRHGDSVAVLFVDLDNFKVINDSLGHSAGDALLIGVAQRLHGSLRTGDSACRFGGDEFAIVLEMVIDAQQAVSIAERLVQVLQAPFTLADRDVFVTASVGIAVSESRDETPDTLLKKADAAMYEAKRKGRDGFAIFQPNMGVTVLKRLELEGDLRRALDRHEFTLCYQPIVDLRSGRVTGMEALLRWIHPARGLVAPLDFISLAEETGLIVPIGRWVLERSCQALLGWQTQFPPEPGEKPLRVSVNLSVRQMHEAGFVASVASILKSCGIAPSSLMLEITENIVIEEGDTMLGVLHGLRDLGVLLAIDDFGTGYSSLSYLKTLPIEYLKIDRKFVTGLTVRSLGEQTPLQSISEIERSSGDEAILSSVIGLAHNLRLTVIAEGAEVAGEVECLTNLGCDLAQGYYFAPPIPQTLVETFLENDAKKFLKVLTSA